MSDENTEPTRPVIPTDLDAVEKLFELAGAFLPGLASAVNARVPPVQERYRMLIEQLPAATFMAWFENGQSELYVSSHIETLLGYTATEWAEDPILWYQRLYPEDRARWNDDFARTVATAAPFKGEYRFVAKDGRVVWIHGEAKVLRDESGHPTFMHGIGYDITELKRIEQKLRQARDEAQRANLAKSEFLSRTSHELRTPLNGIIGFAEFLIDGKPGPLNPRQKEYLQDIYNSGKHLLQLINDVLDLAKVETGKMGLSRERFSLRMAVEEVSGVARPAAQKQGVHVEVHVAPELSEVTLDQQKFKQILYNLLSNAIKFTDRGGNVKIRVESEDVDRFKLIVKDTGIGIKSEDLPRLFQEFEQLDSGASRRYGGTGLGLALTKKFVELQGGTIAVETSYGQGSTFSVVLPRRLTEENVHGQSCSP